MEDLRVNPPNDKSSTQTKLENAIVVGARENRALTMTCGLPTVADLPANGMTAGRNERFLTHLDEGVRIDSVMITDGMSSLSIALRSQTLSACRLTCECVSAAGAFNFIILSENESERITSDPKR